MTGLVGDLGTAGPFSPVDGHREASLAPQGWQYCLLLLLLALGTFELRCRRLRPRRYIHVVLVLIQLDSNFNVPGRSLRFLYFQLLILCLPQCPRMNAGGNSSNPEEARDCLQLECSTGRL